MYTGAFAAILIFLPFAAQAQTVATSSGSILDQVLSLQQLVDSLQQQISQLEAQINTLTGGGGTDSQPAQITGSSSSLPNIFAPVNDNSSAYSNYGSYGDDVGTAAQNLLQALQSPTGFLVPSAVPVAATTTATTTTSVAPPINNDSMCPIGEVFLYSVCMMAPSP